LTILITGGTGPVGPRLLSRFVSAGIECRGLARAGKQLPAGVAAVEGDILSPDTLPAAVAGVSAVVHLAALFRTSDDDQIRKVNVGGTRNLIAAVKEHAPKARFLMASTANIYDDNASHPGREDDEVAPTLSYPASKYEAEKELQSSGLNWGILRFPFIYGDKDGHVEGLPELVACGRDRWMSRLRARPASEPRCRRSARQSAITSHKNQRKGRTSHFCNFAVATSELRENRSSSVTPI
jgi:UDP-glucose 4-epimerase